MITTCTNIKDIKIVRYFMIHYETELHFLSQEGDLCHWGASQLQEGGENQWLVVLGYHQ